jgi:hypothetical protein
MRRCRGIRADRCPIGTACPSRQGRSRIPEYPLLVSGLASGSSLPEAGGLTRFLSGVACGVHRKRPSDRTAEVIRPLPLRQRISGTPLHADRVVGVSGSFRGSRVPRAANPPKPHPKKGCRCAEATRRHALDRAVLSHCPPAYGRGWRTPVEPGGAVRPEGLVTRSGPNCVAPPPYGGGFPSPCWNQCVAS